MMSVGEENVADAGRKPDEAVNTGISDGDGGAGSTGGDEASEEEREDGPSRRKIVGGVAAVIAGALAVGAGVVASRGCTPDDTGAASAEKLPEEGVSQNPSALYAGARKISPADDIAQSVLLALCPGRIASLVRAPVESETARGVSKLSVTGSSFDYTGEGGKDAAGVLSAIRKVGPDLVLHVQFGSLGADDAFEKLVDERIGVPCKTVSTTSVTALFSQVAQLLGEAVPAEAAECLNAMEEALSHVAGIADESKFTVLPVSDPTGLTAFGGGTAMSAMVERAGAKTLSQQAGYSGRYYLGAGAVVSEYAPDVAVLDNPSAFKECVDDGVQDYWNPSPVSQTGHLLPGLVARSLWLCDASSLSLLAIGALWLADVLYPDVVSVNLEDVVTGYFAALYGTSLGIGTEAERAQKQIDAFRGKTKAQIEAEVKEYQEKKDEEWRQMWEEQDAANQLSEEEEEEILKAAEEERKRIEQRQKELREELGLE